MTLVDRATTVPRFSHIYRRHQSIDIEKPRRGSLDRSEGTSGCEGGCPTTCDDGKDRTSHLRSFLLSPENFLWRV